MNVQQSASGRFALACMLLADVCSKMHPIFTKLLYREGWSALSIYFMTLVFIVILLALHEFMMIDGKHRWDIGTEDIKGILLTTLTGGIVSPLLFMIGLQRVSASDAVLIGSLSPLFIVIFAVLMLKEHFTPRMIAGGTLLMAGIAALFWRNILQAELNQGVIILILAAATGALTTTLHKKYVKHRHLDSIVLVRSIISLISVGVLMGIFEPASFTLALHPPSIWTVLGLSVIAFIVPYFLYFKSLKHVKAVDAGIVLTAGPAIGLVMTSFFLGETIGSEQLLSLALIATGILLINVPLTKWHILPMRLMAIGPLRR